MRKKGYLLLLLLAGLLLCLPLGARADTEECQHSWVLCGDPATCTENGWQEWQCEKCYASRDYEVLPALGHAWSDWSTRVEATCTGGGTEYRQCSRCGEAETRDTAALGHSWDGGAVTSAPTCTADGVRTYTCTRCGAQRTESVPAAGHSPAAVPAVAATCESGGKTEGSQCSVCGAVLTAQQDTPALGHSWDGGAVTAAPTCTADGVRTFTCTRCGAQRTESVPAAGHSPAAIPAVAATCESGGKTEGSQCSACGAVLTAQRDTPALGHSWNGGAVTAAPTCTADGVKTFTCTRCGATRTEPVPAAGHRPAAVPAVAATCESGGKTEGSRCSACGAVLTAQRDTPALGHSWDGGVVTKEPGYLNPGEITYTCSVCGKSSREETDVLPMPAFLSGGGFNGVVDPGKVDLKNEDPPLVIVTQPVGGMISHTDGTGYYTLSVEAIGGTSPYHYLWYRYVDWYEAEDRPLGQRRGEDSPEFTVTQPGKYYCAVTDSAGIPAKVYSNVVEVGSDLYIYEQPENTNLYGKDSVTLSCKAAGGTPFGDESPYIYAWYDQDDTQVSFSDSGTAEVSAEGEYHCLVQDMADAVVASDTVTVYSAEPLEIVNMSEDQELEKGEEGDVWVIFSGGVAPYTVTWMRDGVEIPSVQVEETEYWVEITGDGSKDVQYTVVIVDAMGNWIIETRHVYYPRLKIIRQPVGGMLPMDGSGLVLSVVVQGTDKYTYTLCHDGYPEITHIRDGSFFVRMPGQYYIHIEDPDGRWADSDQVFVKQYGFSIVDYTPRQAELSAETSTASGDSGCILQVTTEGGKEPIVYTWKWRSFDGTRECVLPDSSDQACANIPGYYYCEACDGLGFRDETGLITVTASEKKIYILQEPEDQMWEYDENGYSGTLSCDAITEAGDDQFLTFSWWKKSGDRWKLLGSFDKELSITEPGQYRCQVFYTSTGESKYTREALVQVRMICLRAEQVKNKPELKLEFVGGSWPYEIIDSQQCITYYDHDTHDYTTKEMWWWDYYWGWNTIASDGPTKKYCTYDINEYGHFAFTMKGMPKYKTVKHEYGSEKVPYWYSFTVRDAFGQVVSVYVDCSYD